MSAISLKSSMLNNLTPNSENWDPNKWVSEVQNIKQELYQLNIQLQLAEDTYKEFFKV